MGYNCSYCTLKDKCSVADEERRREQWMQTGYQMKKERRQELDGQMKVDDQMRPNYVGDLGGDQIPPPGYMPVPRMQSSQASTSFYYPPSCVEDQEEIGFAGAAARSPKGKGKATDPVQTRAPGKPKNSIEGALIAKASTFVVLKEKLITISLKGRAAVVNAGGAVPGLGYGANSSQCREKDG
ncbi:hypothetical protein E4U60_005592 [Claviceps pazoutovae]|uniref:Uncharacterized protein n=1 Tax=Claviceps pazoutovae TaxID=1649127 RepID=A0A9P7MK25_9HYPO|nr:hypothetical protein E4U60_005592 [Claviceps pazoutovae]